MDETQSASEPFVGRVLPWIIGAVAFAFYAATLNRWVSLSSLPWVALASGWDWSLPQQAPLFFLIALPARALPASWQPVFLNALTALTASLILALLARSVHLLPHDRTHDQRQRERSEFALLSIAGAWAPPVLAAAVCGLELSFWENATSATNQILSLLLLAYPIRCALEFRIDRRRSWLYRASFVYALGMTNNAGMVGLLPLFLLALIWICGAGFFEFQFLARMTACGLAGVSLYLALPAAWTLADGQFGFFELLRAGLGAQKAFLFDVPGLRNRALLLSLTSLLPVALMGVRWPSNLGDTSAAGTKMTQLMFRVMHLLFLAACLWVAFDFQFSPRALALGYGFLSFYYLGALAVGYYSGYALLVFGERKSRRRRSSAGALAFGSLIRALVWIAVAAVPAALICRNWPVVRAENGSLLERLASLQAQELPQQESIVLSDDQYDLLLVEGYLSGHGAPRKHLMLCTKLLPLPFYQRRLELTYPGRWRSLAAPDASAVNALDLLNRLTEIAKRSIPTTPIVYLEPSFGYYFERFYAVPTGLDFELKLYLTNRFLPPDLAPQVIADNQRFWKTAQPLMAQSEKTAASTAEGAYAAVVLSRALNAWGVRLQRQNLLAQAAPCFASAARLNTNNIPARVNLAFNEKVRSGKLPPEDLSAQSIEDRFGGYRQWDRILSDNGPFDEPEFCFRLGQNFEDQKLYRQSGIELHRAAELDPQNPSAWLALAELYLNARLPDDSLSVVQKLRQWPAPLPLTNQVALAQLEAGDFFAKHDLAKTEKLLLAAQDRFATNQDILDSLVQFYGGQQRWTNAMRAVDRDLRLAPNDPEALLKKSSIYAMQRQYDRSLSVLDGLLENAPQHLPALLMKGAILLQTKKYDAALAVFQKILAIDPDNVEAKISCAAAYLEKKSYAQAIPLLGTVLEKHPSNWAALRNRAIARLRLQQWDDSAKDYQALLRIDPNYYPALFGLGEIAFHRNDVADAVRNYERYLKCAPDGPEQSDLAAERRLVLERLKELRGKRL